MGSSLSAKPIDSPVKSFIDPSSLFHCAHVAPSRDDLQAVFNRYAGAKSTLGVSAMLPSEFVQKYLGLHKDLDPNSAQIHFLARTADRDKDGLVSFEDFVAFEQVLREPDALYRTSFEIFNKSPARPGHVSFDDFIVLANRTRSVQLEPLNVKSDFFDRYFGQDRGRLLGYLEFCQLLRDFHGEQALEAFRRFDSKRSGQITSAQFCEIMTTARRHALSPFVKGNLIKLLDKHGVTWVSFPFFVAFNSLLDKLETVKRVYLTLARGNLHTAVNERDFLKCAQAYAELTPLEVELLFHLGELMHVGIRQITLDDLELIDPCPAERSTYTWRFSNIVASTRKTAERNVTVLALENAYRFALGSLAGAAGATAVYPIDLVKTRMQNQRTAKTLGEVMYTDSVDCFKKVIRREGPLGLYRGLGPQLMGVAPEKAIKLTVNDFVRDKFTEHGRIPFWAEVVAGGCGGASQVMFTNPVEIIKIRLQVAGEVASERRVGVASILRELGLRGVYKGSSACFLRDIPFSAIYFPLYAHAKLQFADKDGHNSPWSLFCAALLAGAPAAGLCTPPDVIKTRLQVAARSGQTTYNGLWDCARKIYHEEGGAAFWKGSTARVLRSSPQFGVTLMVYEVLQRLFYVDFGGSRPVGSEVPGHKMPRDQEKDHNPDHLGGYGAARSTLLGVQRFFGLQVPG